MSDPLRTDPSRAPDAVSEPDRDAKIEQLLLSGLDQYFAARYEQAINIWTRALFIDRNHPRARAYIERARSAMAERLRESEELLQNGVAAFRRGENDEARRLVQAALDRGAPLEDALTVLERLNRLDAGAEVKSKRATRERAVPALPPPTAASRPVVRPLLSFVALLAIVFAGAFGIVSKRAGWERFDWNRVDWGSVLVRQPAAPAPITSPLANEVMPVVPRRGETMFARARALAASGHLRDALALLDGIRPTDPLRPEADRLRADVQRQLLGLTSGLAPQAVPATTPSAGATP